MNAGGNGGGGAMDENYLKDLENDFNKLKSDYLKFKDDTGNNFKGFSAQLDLKASK